MSFKDFRKTIKEENGTIEAPVSAPSVSPVPVVPEIPHEVPATVQEPAPEMAKSMAGATGRLINMKGNQGIYKMIITDIEGNKTVGKVYFSIMGREAEVEISFIIGLNGENLKVSYPEGKRIEAEIESVLGESTTNSFKNYLRELEKDEDVSENKPEDC